MQSTHLAAAACLGLTLALAGCYEEIDSNATPARDAEDAASGVDAPTTQAGDRDDPARAYGNSRSTLGKAKDSAEGTIADLEARDRELQKQIDDDRP